MRRLAYLLLTVGLLVSLLWAQDRRRETSEPDYFPFVHESQASYRWQETTPNGRPAGRGRVVTVHRITDSPFETDEALICDMDQGVKREWFLRRRVPEGIEIRFWKVRTRDPDGSIHWFRLDPPTLLFCWPAEPGTRWTVEPTMIVDEIRHEPSTCHVEVLPPPASIDFAGERHDRLYSVRITYTCYLGQSSSIFLLADGVGMLRETQTKQDGNLVVTELEQSSLSGPRQALLDG